MRDIRIVLLHMNNKSIKLYDFKNMISQFPFRLISFTIVNVIIFQNVFNVHFLIILLQLKWETFKMSIKLQILNRFFILKFLFIHFLSFPFPSLKRLSCHTNLERKLHLQSKTLRDFYDVIFFHNSIRIFISAFRYNLIIHKTRLARTSLNFSKRTVNADARKYEIRSHSWIWSPKPRGRSGLVQKNIVGFYPGVQKRIAADRGG